ncbi:NmrA family protein [Mesorhizobium sp. CU2]|uniref:NmrA family NAD(P)-binding protein n=1 Tax=unclassified Mesorhizobium TaxID=325217 RepID=UPI0011266A5E|nr:MULTISPECIES: NmrA family NAD(P)-binding protein [unclassified Mesorhizobium]TPN81143.1 NmrA family protein [Mesorhizobium sp. CU3]TPO17058.1 NmrA family protein [Mesorhizobium sp. CU2]
MKKILIVGATGNFASHVARELATLGDIALRVTSRSEKGLAKLSKEFPHAEVVRAEWTDRDSLVKAFAGVDRALMITPDLTDEAVVVPNTIAAIETSPNFDLLVRLIAIPPITADEMTEEWLNTKVGTAAHWVAKDAFKGSDVPIAYVNVSAWTAYTLPWLCGEAIRTRREMPITGDALRNWIVESDASELMAKMLKEGSDPHQGEEYIVTGPEKLTFPDIARILSEELGEVVTWVDSSDSYESTAGDMAEALAIYTRYSAMHGHKQPVTDTINKQLGRPATSLRQYFRNNLHLFK